MCNDCLNQLKWVTIIGAIVVMIFFYFLVISFAEEVDTTKAVIHHTASKDVSASTIDQWHKDRGWDEIGYHFIIRKDGTVEKGRNLNKQGAHAKGRDHYIGIALTGNNQFTSYQIKSLNNLLKRLGVKHIERHHEKCPGYGDKKLNELIENWEKDK